MGVLLIKGIVHDSGIVTLFGLIIQIMMIIEPFMFLHRMVFYMWSIVASHLSRAEVMVERFGQMRNVLWLKRVAPINVCVAIMGLSYTAIAVQIG
jgi:hypothetical protein